MDANKASWGKNGDFKFYEVGRKRALEGGPVGGISTGAAIELGKKIIGEAQSPQQIRSIFEDADTFTRTNNANDAGIYSPKRF